MIRHDAELEQMAASLRELNPELDELSRARIQARLSASIERADQRKAQPFRALAWGSVAALAAVAAVALLWLGDGRSPANEASSTAVRSDRAIVPPVAETQPRTALPAEAAAALGFEPYCVSGAGARAALPLLGQLQRVLDVPAHSSLQAALGANARVTLVGPARLELATTTTTATATATAERVELSLAHGQLALDYEGAPGGELIVRTAHARIRVVGTRFALIAGASETRVGVETGVVEVEHGGRARSIVAGSAWRSGADVTMALGADLRALLHAHERALLPPPVERGLLSIEDPGVGVFTAMAPKNAKEKRSFRARKPVRAKLADRVLGDAPVWALVPVGPVAVTVEDARGGSSVVKTDVAAARTTSLAAPSASSPRASPSPALQKSVDGGMPQPDPTSAASLYQRAEQALRARDHATARRQLERLLARFPSSAEAEPALYELAQLAHDCDQARPLLSGYLGRYPHGRFATGARERLARCQGERATGAH